MGHYGTILISSIGRKCSKAIMVFLTLIGHFGTILISSAHSQKSSKEIMEVLATYAKCSMLSPFPFTENGESASDPTATICFW